MIVCGFGFFFVMLWFGFFLFFFFIFWFVIFFFLFVKIIWLSFVIISLLLGSIFGLDVFFSSVFFVFKDWKYCFKICCKLLLFFFMFINILGGIFLDFLIKVGSCIWEWFSCFIRFKFFVSLLEFNSFELLVCRFLLWRFVFDIVLDIFLNFFRFFFYFFMGVNFKGCISVLYIIKFKVIVLRIINDFFYLYFFIRNFRNGVKINVSISDLYIVKFVVIDFFFLK